MKVLFGPELGVDVLTMTKPQGQYDSSFVCWSLSNELSEGVEKYFR